MTTAERVKVGEGSIIGAQEHGYVVDQSVSMSVESWDIGNLPG